LERADPYPKNWEIDSLQAEIFDPTQSQEEMLS